MGIADRFPSFREARWRRARLYWLVLLLIATALAGCLAVQSSPGTVSRARGRRLATPTLPETPYPYASMTQAAAARLARPGVVGAGIRVGGPARFLDNTPASNPITDAGATLGRVLFYDTRLSANDRVACASCHIQAFGFSDTSRFSRGFEGGLTRRHAMALANAGFYRSGRFFWDERAATLEAQVLLPVQDAVEMGMTLPALEAKLRAAGFYQPLFEAAFGTPEITSDRIARSLAQFIRALVSVDSRFDRAESAAGMTPEERQGLLLFTGRGMCWSCHLPNTFASDGARNTGLDTVSADSGAGRGRFKAPSLRNVAVRPPYMHDGRFATLEQVIEHYDQGVQLNPNLDSRLRGPRGDGTRTLGLSAAQKAALVAYLHTLTDSAFLVDPRFADPFPQARRP